MSVEVVDLLAGAPTVGNDDGQHMVQLLPQTLHALDEHIGQLQIEQMELLQQPERIAAAAKRPSVPRPGEMPVEHMSAITPTEVLRWHTPRKQEANR